MQEDHEDLKSNQYKNTTEKVALVVTPPKVLEVQEKPPFLKELSRNTELMNKLISEIQQINENWTHYEKSIAYGHYLTEIKNQIKEKPLEIIKSLMNTGIGFKTDRPNDKCREVYSDEIIKNCVVQAIMHGLRIHGNEFNILGGNFYATKEGLDRIVHNNPLLEEKVKDKVKSFRQDDKTGIWGITFEYTYKLKGESKVTEEIKMEHFSQNEPTKTISNLAPEDRFDPPIPKAPPPRDVSIGGVSLNPPIEKLTAKEDAEAISFLSNSTACLKLTPCVFITQSITEPPAPQPKQLNRLDFGVITQDGVLSAWNGQHKAKSLPCFTSA